MPGKTQYAALCVAFALASPAAFAAAPAASAPAKPAKLGLCAACHGEDGHSRTAGTPHLAGQDEAYLRKALTDFRTGARTAAPMNAIAGTLQAKDIQALARWYATRKPPVAK